MTIPLILGLLIYRLISPPAAVSNMLYGKTAISVTLYSLTPYPAAEDEKRSLFHRFPILGKIELSPSETPSALNGSVDSLRLKAGYVLMCWFKPRHAVSFDIDGKHYDILICYSCGEIKSWCDGEQIDSSYFSGKPDKLNGILTAAGIPLDKP